MKLPSPFLRCLAGGVGLLGLIAFPLAPLASQSSVTGARAGMRSASERVRRISQSSGVLVLADSTVANELAPLPAANSGGAQTVEQQIEALVKGLPPGTTWAKLFLPAPAKGRVWTGDEVVAYALAQATLFGKIGAAPEGSVEILGQQVPSDQARTHIAGLNLKPVYVVTNANRSFQGTLAPSRWQQMTKDERRQYAREQAQTILNLPPARREALLQHLQQQERILDVLEDLAKGKQ